MRPGQHWGASRSGGPWRTRAEDAAACLHIGLGGMFFVIAGE